MYHQKRPCYYADEEEACRSIKRRCHDSFRLAFEDQRAGVKREAESLEHGPSKRRALDGKSGVAQAFLDGVAFAERTIVPNAVERAVEQQLEIFRSILTEQRAAFRAEYDREAAALYIRVSEADRSSRHWIM